MRKPQHFWPTVWAGAVAVLCAIVAVEHFFGGVTVGEGVRPPAKVADARMLPPFALSIEAREGAETVARPLFVPTRRPSPPAAAAAAQSMRRGQFVLTGVSIAQDAAFVFLRESASGKTHSVRKGASVNGLTVEKVEPRKVVLRMGEEVEELTLQVQAPARVAATPVPAGQVPPAPGSLTATVPSRTAAPPGGVPAQPTGAAPALPTAGQATSPQAAPDPSAPASTRRRPWMNKQ